MAGWRQNKLRRSGLRASGTAQARTHAKVDTEERRWLQRRACVASTNHAAPFAHDGQDRNPRESAGNLRNARIMHRLRIVRQQQGVTLRTMTRQLGLDVRTVRAQEDPFNDLRLSELYRWQEVLNVPLAELLVDPGTPLSRPVMERAHLVRLMKTALVLREQAKTPAIERMVKNLIDQLLELMPELAGVAPWHAVGQRRSLEELGRVVDRAVADEIFKAPGIDRPD
jgi:transcriptional regulator with XRE-family HTH domain